MTFIDTDRTRPPRPDDMVIRLTGDRWEVELRRDGTVWKQRRGHRARRVWIGRYRRLFKAFYEHQTAVPGWTDQGA